MAKEFKRIKKKLQKYEDLSCRLKRTITYNLMFHESKVSEYKLKNN